jgi:uncharacterized protein YegL
MESKSTEETPDYGIDMNQGFDFGNLNPDEVEVDETINVLIVVDTSSSVHSYVNELNDSINGFISQMQKSHHAEKIMLSFLTFSNANNINVTNGFQPIVNVPTQDFSSILGGCTALYDGVLTGLTNAIDYRDQLDKTGVETKTLLFVITDGEDNDSQNPASSVKLAIDALNADERGANAFESILFGVGRDASFTQAQIDMGIRQLAQVGDSAEEIRKMIGIISASVSSSASGQGPVNVSF